MKEKNAISGNEKCAGMGELLSNRLISLNFYCYFFKEIEKRNAKATVRRPSEAEDTLARMPTPGVCKPRSPAPCRQVSSEILPAGGAGWRRRGRGEVLGVCASEGVEAAGCRWSWTRGHCRLQWPKQK